MKTTQHAIIKIRKAGERGHADHGWLNSWHTFSFADYHDPKYMGFRSLRVINDDRIDPGKGFGMHPHRDMEIISYVIEGELAHKDSMGNGAVIKAGNFQRMSAGTGVTHGEFNPSAEHATHLLQIWITPREKGIAPSYEELDTNETKENFHLVASGNNEKGALLIHQDAKLFFARFGKAAAHHYTLAKGRGAWIQIIKGALDLNGHRLDTGDGACVENESGLRIKIHEDAQFLLFDLK